MVGRRVKINDTYFTGTVIKEKSDHSLVIKLDNGMQVECLPECITLLIDNDESITATETNKVTEQRDNQGRFLPGHKKIGGIKKGSKTSVRQVRRQLMEQLQPYIVDIGTVIAAIDDPAEQVLAVTRMMRFVMPTYSSVEYTEGATRSLNVEQKMAQLNAKYNNEPDPIPDENEDEE